MPLSRNCTRCGRNFVEYEDTVECPICENPIEKSIVLASKGDDVGKGSKRRRNRRNKNKKKGRNMTQQAEKKGQVTVYNVNNARDSWEVELDEIKTCGKAPEEITVWFETIVKAKIDALMEEYKSIEWLAYLVGKLDMNDLDNIVVEDLVIPKQEITATSVDNVECEEFNDLNIIGVIHSHHGMGNSFSGTDNEWINQNHKISLCVAKSGIAGHLRWKTPCGALMTIKAKCKLKYEVDFDKEDFIKDTKGRIEKKSYTYTYPADGVYRGGYGTYNRGYGFGQHGWNRNDGQKKVANSYIGSGSIKEAAEKGKTEEKDKKDDTWNTNSDDAPTTEGNTVVDGVVVDGGVEFDIQEEESLVNALTEYEKSITEAGI